MKSICSTSHVGDRKMRRACGGAPRAAPRSVTVTASIGSKTDVLLYVANELTCQSETILRSYRQEMVEPREKKQNGRLPLADWRAFSRRPLHSIGGPGSLGPNTGNSWHILRFVTMISIFSSSAHTHKFLSSRTLQESKTHKNVFQEACSSSSIILSCSSVA